VIKHNLFRNITILCLTLIVGLGLAFALPWLANTQGQAAEIEFEFDKESATAEVARYYVAKTGNGTYPTVGWTTAFTNVQDALAAATLIGSGKIWVAAGIYYPDEGVGQIDNAVTSTYVLTNNVVLYGGFETGDTQLSDRDWETNVTVLSGDIDKDDNDPDEDGVISDWMDINGDNAYHVVRALGVNNTAVLDGFTITAGDAHGSFPHDSGGGFYCDGSGDGNVCSPIVGNVTFSGNRAKVYGGAMYNDGSNDGNSNPILEAVTFSRNSASSGGAMYDDGDHNGTSNPSLYGAKFFSNSAGDGGAMHNFASFGGDSSPSLRDVTFSGNTAKFSGGAMSNWIDEGGTSNPYLINVIFSGNKAEFGGAMSNSGDLLNNSNSSNIPDRAMPINDVNVRSTTRPVLTNVTMTGNRATEYGGGIANFGSSPIVRNSILWNNQDNNGTGTITATIFNESSAISITHSLVQETGGSSSWISDTNFLDGGNNIDQNPKFITLVDPATAPTTNGNLRLQSGSPAIDLGDNSFVQGTSTDLDGKPRIVDGTQNGTPTVDMGAYETPIDYPYDNYLPLIFR
jgi:predicted outer membrane repeat protein